jgi:serine/threonine-protein kinase
MLAMSARPRPYHPVLELARGGMGTVELALKKDGSFSRLVAIKRLLPAHRDDVQFRSMFLDEARLAGLVRHPNVVSVTDVGQDESGPYLVMEYVEGVSLSAVVGNATRRNALLPVQLVVRIASEVARGLHAAHELTAHDGTSLHIVHRDVTPQNILLGYDGEVRVADFGIAKAYGRSSRTSTGLLKGKVGYLSPEQLRFRDPDRRSDLFALGVVLFEMLSGRRLYAGDDLEVARRILDEPPPDILEYRDDVPPELVELSFALLAKDPGERPGTALEVARALDTIATSLLTEEDPITVADHLAEHFEEPRRLTRQRVDDAVTRAERALDAPEPKGSSKRVLAFAIAGAAVAAATAGVIWIVASSSDPAEAEVVETLSNPAAAVVAPAPIEPTPPAAPAVEAAIEAAPEPAPRRAVKVRTRSSNEAMSASPRRDVERETTQEPAAPSVPRWDWD